MATLTEKKSVFDMDNDEFKKLLETVAIKAKQSALDNGAWFSHKNELCTEPGIFVHEFKNGRKELIKLGTQTGKFEILKLF